MMPTFSRLVKAVVLITTALAVATLTGCGAGSVKDSFIPDRVVVFGDAISDMSSATTRYTVNDGSINNWAEQVASSYGVTTAKIIPKAVANTKIANLAAQATGFSFLAGDLTLVSGGYRDLIDIAEAGGTSAAMVARARALGTDYANVARGLVSAGAKHVLIINMFDLSKTPYQTLGGRTSITHPLYEMVRGFNDAMKSNLGDSTKPYIGDTIRLGNAETAMSGIFSTATVDMVCSTTAADLGITGIAFSSKGCTTSTLTAPATSTTYDNYVFVDPVNLTPAQHRNLGTGMKAYASW